MDKGEPIAAPNQPETEAQPNEEKNMKFAHFTLSATKENHHPLTVTIELEEGDTINTAAENASRQLTAAGWTPPTAEPAAPASGKRTAVLDCTILYVEMSKGKTSYKIQGRDLKNDLPYLAHGIRIWPETLEAAGITPADIPAADGYTMTGWKADFIFNDEGKAKKIIKLHPPAA